MSSEERKEIRVSTPQELGAVIQDMVLDGWEIDEKNPPSVFGWHYEFQMIKNRRSTDRCKQRLQDLIDSKPKLSRAEIMEKARAARGKKEAEADE